MFGWLKGRKVMEESPDYSGIDNMRKVGQLVDEGHLVKLHLLPLEFGGTDVPDNCIYVPPFVVEIKQRADRNIIMPLVEKGVVTRYIATPKYQGGSFVPCAIDIKALDPGNFNEIICIWGEGLSYGTEGAA